MVARRISVPHLQVTCIPHVIGRPYEVHPERSGKTVLIISYHTRGLTKNM
jgi:hypothetical protein